MSDFYKETQQILSWYTKNKSNRNIEIYQLVPLFMWYYPPYMIMDLD